MRRLLIAACAAIGLSCADGNNAVSITVGDLTATFAGNEDSPDWLSGVRSLSHRARPVSAFDDAKHGQGGGLNFEHLTSGHASAANAFEPRFGTMRLEVLPTGDGVELHRPREASHWAVESWTTYQLVAPHYLDLAFRCLVHEPERFDPQGYALFFFASYMYGAADPAIWFPSDGAELAAADVPGVYRAREAEPLELALDHDWPLNSGSHDAPRIDAPWYFGELGSGMVWALLFDRLVTESDEVRFALFTFKGPALPAWDFAYVLRDLEAPCGFRARAIYKPFAGAGDLAREHEAWRESL